MALDAVAEALALAPQDDVSEARLRACLTNLLAGIERHHINIEVASERLTYMEGRFWTMGKQDHGGLLAAHMESLLAFGEQDQYARPGPLNDHLRQRAVTIQSNEDGSLGRYWLEDPTAATDGSASATELVSAFNEHRCTGTVGRPGRPIWLTPYEGEIRRLCEIGSNPACSPDDRARIARAAVSSLGLSHFHEGDEIIAMVTRKTIGELGFTHPVLGLPSRPVGPSAIDARGHGRFRAWPGAAAPDRYGRTYELDRKVRHATPPPDAYGLPEAVRPTLPISEFEHCVFLGPLHDVDLFHDVESDFLDAIGADAPCDAILLRLVEATGR